MIHLAKGHPGIRSVPAIAALMMGLTACGGSDTSQPTGPDDPDPGPFTEVACSGFSLGASSGMPLERISIGQLPSSFSLPAAAAVSLPDGAPGGLAFVLEGETGNLELSVPLHPTSPLGGGAVTLTFTDGTRACAPIDFAIQAMPPADGEFAAVLDLLQEVLTEQAARFDVTPAHLVAEPLDELAPGIWPLALAQTVLDDPANPGSLRAVADGALGGEALDWLNRMLARTDVRSELENPPPDPTAGEPRVVSSAASAFGCLPSTVGSSAALLNDCMTAGAEALRSAEGISAQVAADIIRAFGAAGQVGLPVAGVVGSVFGFMSWGIYSQRLKAAALYPSAFTAMNVQVDRESFAEDEEELGRVSYAEVYATNLGYNLLNELIDGIKAAVSLAEAAGDFDFSTGTPADEVAGDLQNQLGPIIEERLRGLDIEAFDIPPELFGPVNVTDPMWIQARVATGQSIEVVDGTTYRPILHGESVLSVRTTDGEFGGQQIAEQVDVEVETLMVTITPAQKFVAPSDPANLQFETFEVRIENSVHPDMVDLDLSDHPEQGFAEIRVTEGGNTHFVDYLAPEHPDFDEQDLIVVRHTAETGARKNGPERTAIATIDFGALTISPQSACVELSAMETFSVMVEGPLDDAVHWTATVGSIDEDGEYTAPSAQPPGGTATIKAVSVEQPGLEDEVIIQIGCTCQSTLTVAGVTVTAQPGDQVFFNDWGGPEEPYGNNFEFYNIVFRNDGKTTYTLPLDDNPATWPTLGPNAVRVQGSVGISSPELIYSSDDEFPAILTLSEYIPETKAVGSVQAQVTIISSAPPFSEPATLSWDFAVTVPPGYQRTSGPFPPHGYPFSCTVAGG